MRSHWAVVFPLLATLVVPFGHAHGDAVQHVNPVTLELRAGEGRQLEIEFEEGQLRKDWVFLLNVVAYNGTGPVDVAIISPTAVLKNWSIPTDAVTQRPTVRIPEMQDYGLWIRNMGPDAATVVFFYDASCNCAGKPIPPQVPNAAVLFNVDVRKGDRMESIFPEPSVLDLALTHAVRTNERSQWPEDFQILETSRAPFSREGRMVHMFNWTAPADGRHYFYAEALRTDYDTFSRLDPDVAVYSVYIQPSNTRVGEASPVPIAWVAVAIMAAFVVARRRA